ncbi:MAG TPA: YafY family protein [Ktedonobacterales bacterium]|nr:YafY family protein [Ktedonobacterales bacterium]
MNRTDRLLAIVLELQGKGRQRAEDLAATFETSKRTIYRDLQALGQAGVPIVSIPGRGYSLIAGYFLPPLSFTTDEATLLLLGADVMAQSFDAQYRAAAQSASRKIAGVLPEKLRDETQALRDGISFVGGERTSASALLRLQHLRGAIIGRQSVRFAYYARHSGDQSNHNTMRVEAAPSQAASAQPQTRVADPYALAHVGGTWYLTAFDHERQAMRTFRLDRMDALTPLDQTFTRRPGVARLTRGQDETMTLTARVRFDVEVARWVREAPSFFTVATDEMPDGGLLVTLRLRREDDLTGWVLSWGGHAFVLEPESLRRQVAAEAAAILRAYE